MKSQNVNRLSPGTLSPLRTPAPLHSLITSHCASYLNIFGVLTAQVALTVRVRDSPTFGNIERRVHGERRLRVLPAEFVAEGKDLRPLLRVRRAV